MSFGKYGLVVAGVLGGSWLALWPLLGGASGVREAALLGSALAAANTLAAYGIVLWSARRSTQVFLGAVLGGMLGRMGLMLGAVVAAILLLEVPKLPFTIAVLAYFVVFLVLELAVLHKRTSLGAEAR